MKFSSLILLVSFFLFVLIAGDMFVFFPFCACDYLSSFPASPLWLGLKVDGFKIKSGDHDIFGGRTVLTFARVGFSHWSLAGDVACQENGVK